MVHQSCRGRRELLIMSLRPALVCFLLLSLTRMAESDDCDGTADQVQFCKVGDNLKLDSSSNENVKWTFDGKTTNLPSTVNHDDSDTQKKVLKLDGLSAADSGKYTATYPSGAKNFLILVGAVTCPAAGECKVVKGSSIEMDSGAASETVAWTHKKTPGGPDTSIPTINFPDNNKKKMGLFNLNADNAGTYEAKYPSGEPKTTKTFTVSVQDPITTVKIEGDGSVCAGGKVILKCEVTGDAKDVTWKKNTSPQTTNVDGKVMTINGAKPDDAGEYTCHAKSYLGGQPVDSPRFPLAVSAAVDCEKQQKGTNSSTSIINNNEEEDKKGNAAARAASCSVALVVMTSLLQLCWMV
ncbi:basement membrane-specific heparan sulfate proteoglycan core protein-like [Syngnathus typhle]|uniref:basement membrane-specific heparan sulfate proteoglycan core protein-like n=1 Tax=Syngnathus typhle TaxID=161592 RepID=UPI002A69EB14|nr:basement membrane-specific heparan sulfate proteoglycan core protein-like [Syngnathus typhle]XP_061125344.1 basement membrane-specific heparan sulfate proteoglycan core protein-like [Syngnathus typhle]XP_061125345.1 basement membrane-specific heparan sulfate proteoglycan core protein-like [Syngnathus typhle]